MHASNMAIVKAAAEIDKANARRDPKEEMEEMKRRIMGDTSGMMF